MANTTTAYLQPTYTIDGIQVTRQPLFFGQARFPQTRDLTRVTNGSHVTYVPCFFFWSDEPSAGVRAGYSRASPSFRMYWNDVKFLDRMEDCYEEYLESLAEADLIGSGNVLGDDAIHGGSDDHMAMDEDDAGALDGTENETTAKGSTEMMRSRL